jgi:hypothetical protein
VVVAAAAVLPAVWVTGAAAELTVFVAGADVELTVFVTGAAAPLTVVVAVPGALVVTAGAVGVAGAEDDGAGADTVGAAVEIEGAAGAAVEVADATVELAVEAVWVTGVVASPARATSAKPPAQASAPRRISNRMENLFARVYTSLLFPGSKPELTPSAEEKSAFCWEVTHVSDRRRLYPCAVLADEVVVGVPSVVSLYVSTL